MEPTIAVMDGKLFTYGATPDACKQAFRSQIIGAPPHWQRSMLARITYLPVTDDMASEVCEALAADVIAWG